jgi:hypothetical protein
MVVGRSKKPTARTASATNRALMEERLQRIEDDWMAARIQGEAESTQILLDENYQGSTSAGIPQTKADFLNAVRSSRLVFKDFVHTERIMKIHGNTAISTGVATLSSPGKQHSFRYLRVFLKRRNDWCLIASQSTPLRIKS